MLPQCIWKERCQIAVDLGTEIHPEAHPSLYLTAPQMLRGNAQCLAKSFHFLASPAGFEPALTP